MERSKYPCAIDVTEHVRLGLSMSGTRVVVECVGRDPQGFQESYLEPEDARKMALEMLRLVASIGREVADTKHVVIGEED